MHKICQNGEIVLLDNAYLHNNLWGEESGSGAQCCWIEAFSENTKCINWKTSWEWEEANNSIKSFASIVHGWHFGWKNSNTEFPIKIDNMQKIDSFWKFELKENIEGNLNITYDMWFSNRQIDSENPDGEIMIWLYKKGNVPPIGKKVKEIEVGGIIWDLWIGLHPQFSWPVFSFIKQKNTTEAKLELHKFITEICRNENYNFTYLLGIQSGIEVLSGAGTFSTTEYFIEIEK